ncbi:MAG: hypothetical protein R2792_15745 [Saprospiraceae bacterium]
MLLFNFVGWWQELSTPEQWFFGIGLISNLFFIIYILLQLVGQDSDLDVEVEDADFGFAVLSVRSILAFGMFLGYTGIVALRAGLGVLPALIAGIFAGVMAAWLAYKLIRLLLGLQSSGTLDLDNAIGKTATAHSIIPAGSTGFGTVMIELQGGLREIEAVTENAAIPTGNTVLVVGLNDQGQLLVQEFIGDGTVHF